LSDVAGDVANTDLVVRRCPCVRDPGRCALADHLPSKHHGSEQRLVRDIVHHIPPLALRASWNFVVHDAPFQSQNTLDQNKVAASPGGALGQDARSNQAWAGGPTAPPPRWCRWPSGQTQRCLSGSMEYDNTGSAVRPLDGRHRCTRCYWLVHIV